MDTMTLIAALITSGALIAIFLRVRLRIGGEVEIDGKLAGRTKHKTNGKLD